MNRNQKIVVSIIGITIVLLALLGITYAYYLTRIEGNTNTNSISITTADLKLEYRDGDASIIGSGKTLIPDSDNPVGTKVFTVTNKGNETVYDYAVTLENFAVRYVSNTGNMRDGEVTNFVNGEDGEPDMKLVITCRSYKNYATSKDEVGTCEGMNGFLPEKSVVLLKNTIDRDITHEYTATLTYLDDGTNQSGDMGKTITGKFNIIDTKNTIDIEGKVENYNSSDIIKINDDKESVIYTDGTYKIVGVQPDFYTIQISGSSTNEIGQISVVKGIEENVSTTINNGVSIPKVTFTDKSGTVIIDVNPNNNTTIVGDFINPYKSGSLAYEIYKNAKNTTQEQSESLGYAMYSRNPKSTVVTSKSLDNESVLVPSIDDYGTTYYFRGNVKNNYVNFSGLCWRIVRIQGDGSIKMILASNNGECDIESSLTSNSAKIGGTVNYGYKKDDATGIYSVDYVGSSTGAKTQLNDWLASDKFTDFSRKQLKEEKWCIGDLKNGYSTTSSSQGIIGEINELDSNKTAYLFSAGFRHWIKPSATFVCDATGEVDGEIDLNKIGMLTYDEIVYAGAQRSNPNDVENKTYYLFNNTEGIVWWMLSVSSNNSASRIPISLTIVSSGGISAAAIDVGSSIYARPSVVLKSDILTFKGDGTQSNPYYIS